MEQRYLFGPIPSRRLGISLGVDLVPLKTCTLNCVYCECGRTTKLTLNREEYVPVDAVLAELDQFLKSGPDLDYITFAGSGEPTLHKYIGQVVNHLKNSYPQYSVCLLTNGTLFSAADIRAEVGRFDLIIPSLDAATEEVFQQLNRPHPALECKRIISGLAALCTECRGKAVLEIFIVPGLNDTSKELTAIKAAIEKINPDRVQLGTLDRPGAEPWVKGATTDKLQKIATYLGSKVELIKEFQPRLNAFQIDKQYQNAILQILRRRPCTVQDLSTIIGAHPAEVQKYLRRLLNAGLIIMKQEKRGTFVKVKDSHLTI